MTSDQRLISRRAFLGYSSAMLTGVVAASFGRRDAAQAAGGAVPVSSWQWRLQPQDFLVLTAPGSSSERRVVAVTRPVEMQMSYNAIGAAWTQARAGAPPWQLEFRSSADGQLWSPWVMAPPLHQASGVETMPRPRTMTDAIGMTGAWVQARLSLPSDGADRQIELPRRTVVTLVRSVEEGVTLTAAGSPLQASRWHTLAVQGAPSIISRAGWGADESLRFNGAEETWPPQYATPRVFVVHHTVTANDDPDPAATVRAIYYYHARTLGWGDIGYNFLVDSSGNIYEGRFGGIGANAGHTLNYNNGSVGIAMLGNFETGQPSGAALEAIAALVQQIAAQYGIDPEGQRFFVDRTFNTVAGHRDYTQTACPGQHLYAMVPYLRGAAAAAPPADYRAEYLQHGLPARMQAGSIQTVAVRLRNAGGDTWTRGGSRPYRIGYRWYDAQGNKYNHEADLEVHTDLPQDVAPGQEVTISMTVRTPLAAGVYHLKVDMVHELVTWFEDAGSPPLLVNVEVAGFAAAADYRTAWLEQRVPAQLRRGTVSAPLVRVRNVGRDIWTRGGPNPYRIGYRWYDAQGNKYNNEPDLEVHTSLAANVAPGAEASVRMALRAPRIPGRYTLKVDMVHELVTWFEDAGNGPMYIAVNVT